MRIEKYTVILKHELVCVEETVEIEQPIVKIIMFNRECSPIVINEMMDRFKEEIIKRIEEAIK